MANAGTFTTDFSTSESVQTATVRRVRAHDPGDKRVFDRLTQLVAALLDVPVSLLLVADADQLLFASFSGPEDPWAEIEEFPIAQAYCQHALGSRAAFTVEDSRINPLVCDLAPTTELGVVAYLGVPLLTSKGEAMGILCAMDFEPRAWSERDIHVVEELAATVMAYIEARPRDPVTNGSGGGLNIAAVSRRTGVASDTLRKWERRYGVLRPRRTPGGQRRYDELDVARVEWLRERLAEGFRIGAAAALLHPADYDSAQTVDELREALVAAAQLGNPSRLRGLVERTFVLRPFAEAVEQVIAPALQAVGDGWEEGSNAIGREHLLSEIVRARLERMLADNRAGVRGTIVLACASAERHDLGLLALAVMLQADGWLVAYLGADAPLGAALALAGELGAGAICISVTLAESLERLATELASSPENGPTIVVGGPAVTRSTKLPATLAIGSLTDVVEQLRSV